nr:metal-dependent transcriptional regulator [uncultured Caproiciproducens sp.]
MEIRKSSEDYLEMMLMLQEKHGYVRSIDIAEELHVKKPSVSVAVKRLRENGYITMAEDNLITLTDKGMEIASHMYNRHKVLTKLLVDLGVDVETARTDACKIEHDLSEKSFEAIQEYLEEIERTEKKQR